MKVTKGFHYLPAEYETEKASNSYLLTLLAIIAGIHLPIVNLIAAFVFFLGNRKGTYFVRWHCTQVLLSQITFLFINSFGFWWTVSIIFSSEHLSTKYIAYIFTIILFNLGELILTIFTAIKTRKGEHIEWFFFGALTNLICKP